MARKAAAKNATKKSAKKANKKAPARSSGGVAASRPAGDPAAYLKQLEHPLKAELLAARKVIVNAAPGIVETVKWASLSFRAADDFATFHARETKKLSFVFHTGVKAKATAASGVPIPTAVEQAGIVRWLAKDRAMVTLGGPGEVDAKLPLLAALVRAWVAVL